MDKKTFSLELCVQFLVFFFIYMSQVIKQANFRRIKLEKKRLIRLKQRIIQQRSRIYRFRSLMQRHKLFMCLLINITLRSVNRESSIRRTVSSWVHASPRFPSIIDVNNTCIFAAKHAQLQFHFYKDRSRSISAFTLEERSIQKRLIFLKLPLELDFLSPIEDRS